MSFNTIDFFTSNSIFRLSQFKTDDYMLNPMQESLSFANFAQFLL